MSAFIVSDRCLYDVVKLAGIHSVLHGKGAVVRTCKSGLVWHTEGSSTARLLEKLYAMNEEAVEACYGLPHSGRTFPKTMFSIGTNERMLEPTAQMVKSLQCYLHQCNEGDVPKKQLFKRLKGILEWSAPRALEETEEYKEADWG